VARIKNQCSIIYVASGSETLSAEIAESLRSSLRRSRPQFFLEDELVEQPRRFSWRTSLYWLLITTIGLCCSAGAQGTSGAATFKSKCALCHGPDGTGNTALGKQLQAANLRSKEVQKKPDAELHKSVHDGNGNMPPFQDQLSEDEITQVIKYVRQLGRTVKKQ
jgi:cytochrome c6